MAGGGGLLGEGQEALGYPAELHGACVQAGHAKQGVDQPVQPLQLPAELPTGGPALLRWQSGLCQLAAQQIQGGEGSPDLVGDVGQEGGHLVLIPLELIRLLLQADEKLGELAVENGPGALIVGVQVDAGGPVEEQIQVLAQGIHGPIPPPGTPDQSEAKEGAQAQRQVPRLGGQGEAYPHGNQSQGQEKEKLAVELPVLETLHRRSPA